MEQNQWSTWVWPQEGGAVILPWSQADLRRIPGALCLRSETSARPLSSQTLRILIYKMGDSYAGPWRVLVRTYGDAQGLGRGELR